MARILIVDDDETMLDLEKMILASAGYDVLVAKTALEGLDMLEIYKLDLVIVDIEMPRLNGFDFVTTIRKNPKIADVPIAFISSTNNSKDITRAGTMGATFFLIKPINRADFLKRIQNFFATHKPAAQQKLSLEEPFTTELLFRQSIRVVAMTDMGIEIRASQTLTEGQILEIPKMVFNDIIEKNMEARVASVGTDEETGETKAFLEFSEHALTVIRKIQKFIEGKNRPEALTKYPKWR